MPVSNVPTEGIFSWMNNLWSFETQLSAETLKTLLIKKCNYDMTCFELYEFIGKNNELLKKIHSVEKYEKL